MDDILGEVIELVLEIVFDGLFGSRKKYQNDPRRRLNINTSNRKSYDYSSYNEKKSENPWDKTTQKKKNIYATTSTASTTKAYDINNQAVPPKPMYTPDVKDEKETTKVAEPIIQATVVKEVIKETSKEKDIKPRELKIDSIAEVEQEEYKHSFVLPKAPSINADFGIKAEPVKEFEYDEPDVFAQVNRSDEIKLEIMMLSYMFMEDDGKISGKEKKAIKKHFSKYRGLLTNEDVDEIKEISKLDKSLTNIRAFISSRNLRNTSITNAIRALKDIERGSNKYSSIIARIESALLESMGY